MHHPGCKKNSKYIYSTSSEQIKYIRFTEIRLCIFFEVECVFVILNWKISLCVFSCDRTTKEVTVNGFEDILTVDGSIKRANGIKNIDICDFWMWKYFQTNHMLLGSMKAYFFGRQILNCTYHTKFYLHIDICHIKHQKFFVNTSSSKYCKDFDSFIFQNWTSIQNHTWIEIRLNGNFYYVC